MLSAVPEPIDGLKAEAIAQRLRAYASTLTIWENKKAHCENMIAEVTRAREAFISHLPTLPVWITERGELGADCPDDAA